MLLKQTAPFINSQLTIGSYAGLVVDLRSQAQPRLACADSYRNSQRCYSCTSFVQMVWFSSERNKELMFGNWRQHNLKLGIAGAVVALTALLPFGAALAQDDPGLLVPMDHPMAPFLESRAYAASVGATNEFRKMEWVAVDPVNSRVYWAMSEVSKGMTDGEGAVNVEENLCGIVYAGDLDADNNITKISPSSSAARTMPMTPTTGAT